METTTGTRPVLRPPRRRVRVPGAAIATLALLVFAVLVLAPGLGTALDQQRRIADLERHVAAQKADVQQLDERIARWDDPAYIRSQAGRRLFYVLPGTRTYRVTGTAPAAATPAATARTAPTDWASRLIGSVVEAGTSTATPDRLPIAPTGG